MALSPGSTAGPYRIVEPLGRGGMASVYKAYEAALDRHVALKVLPREFLHDPTFAERFRREAKVVASLEHPNIVPIYAFDIEQDEGIPWMAMRLVAGGALSGLLKRVPMPLARSVAILRGVADALDYAHAKGIVHRDVKPQNILLDEAGRVYLADFGIAKIVESAGGLTATGMITGTPQYMAPEQATGTKIDRRADIYALGIVAYEMFTGRVPFAADTPVAVLMKHMQDPLPLPSPEEVPEPLVRALLRSTSKKPEDRWDTASAFVAALEAGLALPVSAPAGPTVQLPRLRGASATTVVPAATAIPARTAVPARTAAAAPRRSSPTGLVVLGGLVLTVLAVAGAFLYWMRTPLPSPEASLPVVAPAASAPPATLAAALPAPSAPEPSSVPSAEPSPVPPVTLARLPPTAAPRAIPEARPSARPVPPTVAPREPDPVRPAAPAVPSAVQELTAGLGAADSPTRWRAAESLGNLGLEALPAVEALTSSLRDRAPDVRWRSAEALGKIGARAAVPALGSAATDPDALVRAEATKALGLLGAAAEPVVPALARGLRDPEAAVRRESAKALARVGPGARAVLLDLVEGLKAKDKFVRSECAKALGRIGPEAREAVPALSVAARDPELVVSREAALALQKIGGS